MGSVLSERRIKKIIRESIDNIIFETELNYDEDNFSGRYDRRGHHDYIPDDGYIDDPNNPPDDWDSDEPWIGDKDKENEYSWYMFDNERPIYPSVGRGYKPFKNGLKNEIDKALGHRKYDREWTDLENKRGRANMNAWVHNPNFTTDDVNDSWEVFKMMHPHQKYFESRKRRY
jgi:hypothetical protein